MAKWAIDKHKAKQAAAAAAGTADVKADAATTALLREARCFAQLRHVRPLTAQLWTELSAADVTDLSTALRDLVQRELAMCVDFGLDGNGCDNFAQVLSRYVAYRWAITNFAITPMELDHAIANGPALTKLLRTAGGPAANVVITTVYDQL